ncbi:MAG: hypothetical protein HKP48_06300 [Winogradskyella sp.]|uniref:hypothetical protein n=1 Tax=Winogradskyella sp. TaxID=1883156 RepID=UPI0017D6DB53|nr:hypothetical protein [Winogradskyella sp.]MBT8244779.1 hypothetical protein [Winogradskyella sp.]NNK22905.1 hypothetical protein [Winogradskyella sp.]
MKFIHRLGFYLGGFAIGLIILMFFLNGKDASCDYGPNARTVKNISSKKIAYSENTSSVLYSQSIDSTTIIKLIQFGNVNFSESDTKAEPCKVYQIENTYKEREVIMRVKNCSLVATILDFKIEN